MGRRVRRIDDLPRNVVLEDGRRPALLDVREDAIESMLAVKHDDCDHYESCLDVAAKIGWPQFRCDECAKYRKVVTSATSVTSADQEYGEFSLHCALIG